TPLDESPDGSFLDDSTSLSFISVENIPSSRKRPSDSASVSSAGETSSKRQLVDVESFLSKVTSVSLTISAVKDIQLEVLLRASVCGRWILRSYEDDGYLSDEARSDLVDLLVAELLNITTSPTQEEYKILVQKVLELFPTETDEVYYAPPQRSGSHQKLARGKLFDKFRAKKARYGLTSDRSKKKSDPSQSTVEWVLSETEAKSVDFLSKWQEPIEDVNKHWVSAAPHRLQWLKNQDNCEKVADYLSQWPHLKHPENGPKLINIDFELSTLGKEKGDLLLLNWDNFIKSLQSAGDLNNQIRKLKDRMSKAGGQLQPFIAVVGERPNFTSLYVCLDSHLYKVKSIKEAVDLCFKTFYALNCNYPPESEHIWQFFQSNRETFTNHLETKHPCQLPVKSNHQLSDVESSSVLSFESTSCLNFESSSGFESQNTSAPDVKTQVLLPDQFQAELSKSALIWIASLYHQDSVTRSLVQTIIDGHKKFICEDTEHKRIKAFTEGYLTPFRDVH
ncbi:Retinoblastoma-associated protein, partial [Frankliniella fusca]